MVRDFGIMIFQDFLLLVCVYLFLMPLHVMEKKKIKNGLILCGAWCVMLAARLLIPAIGEHLRVFHAFCDHDDCCWTDQQKNKLGNDLLYGLAAHCISLYQYYLEQSTSRFCH